MAVSMDDDVPLILTLDDSGSNASAPLDELEREELPNESKDPAGLSALQKWPRFAFLCSAALPRACQILELLELSLDVLAAARGNQSRVVVVVLAGSPQVGWSTPEALLQASSNSSL